MLKSGQPHTHLTHKSIVATVLLSLTIGIVATALFLPAQAVPPVQGQDATPTPDTMMGHGMMDSNMMDSSVMSTTMSMAEMGAMMDQMMAHMSSMMATVPVSGTMAISGTAPMSGMMSMCGMMSMTGSMPMTGTMPMAGMMSMTGSMPMTGTMPMADMGMMMQMMGMMQMHTGCMQMMMGAMMSGGMMSSGMMGEDTMGDTSGMGMPSDVPFDAMFIDSMIEHHQGAIEMAEMALEQAEHEELRALAEEIIAAQNAETEQMQEWRSEWYPDLAPTEGMGMSMGEMMIGDDESVPFDQRFIEAMISHHQGAIDMAEMALEQAENEEIRTLAEEIIAAQNTEIEQMQSWLSEWYGVSG